MSERKGLLLMDANVLIDFCETDVTVIRLVSDQIGTVHVPTPVLIEEVERIRREDWTALGIVPVEPSLEIVIEAAGRRGGLSFHDWLCLLIAKEAGFTCVTNDVRLRRECEAQGVPVCWGLELLALLVDKAVLTVGAAISLAEAIHRANPAFISLKVLDRFRARIGLPSGCCS